MLNINKQTIGRFGFVFLTTLLIGMIIFIQISEDDRILSLPNMGKMDDFTLPSVDGGNFTFSDTNGEIRLVNFIYTSCQMGCSRQTAMINDVNHQVRESDYNNNVHFITIDFDYKQDTMYNLSVFADKFREEGDRWKFLLGDKNQTLNVTEAWNFSFWEEENNDTMEDHENHTSSITYVHPFILYIVDEESYLRR